MLVVEWLNEVDGLMVDGFMAHGYSMPFYSPIKQVNDWLLVGWTTGQMTQRIRFILESMAVVGPRQVL